MNDPGVTRVAVYVDFDNIVISRYDQVHGRGQFQRDKARGFDRADRPADPDIAEKLQRATVDVGAMIDFASSFGTLVLTRAYADWSALVNADYRGQLVSRAVDLVRRPNTTSPAACRPNGARDVPGGPRPWRPARLISIPRTRRSWPPGSLNERCDSARKRTTRTGCIAPR